LKKSTYLNGFTFFVALVCLLTITLNMINGRFWLADFRVYYCAAKSFISGGQVYRISFDEGSGFFKYNPATLFFFIPYLIFPYKAASVVHFFILGFAYWYTFIIIKKFLTGYFFPKPVKHEILLLSITFGSILIHFTRETYLGNINILLLMLSCAALLEILQGNRKAGGILLGIAILMKPYLVVLLLPLLLRRKFLPVVYTIITVAGISLLPMIYPGPVKGFELYREWLQTMLIHDQGFPGMTSISYFLSCFFFPDLPGFIEWLIFVSVYVVVAFSILDHMRQENKTGADIDAGGKNLAFEWFLILALLPNLIKTDWVLLLFSAPMIGFVIFNLADRSAFAWIPLLVLILFFYSANSDDLLGRTLSHQLLVTGAMGMSNLALTAIAIIMFRQKKSTG